MPLLAKRWAPFSMARSPMVTSSNFSSKSAIFAVGGRERAYSVGAEGGSVQCGGTGRERAVWGHREGACSVGATAATATAVNYNVLVSTLRYCLHV